MFKITRLMVTGCCLLIIVLIQRTQAQSLLDRPITVNVQAKPLGDVLTEISRKGSFYFSYDGRLLRKDSIVSVQATDQPIRILLKSLFNGRYNLEERNNYVILTAPLPRMAVVNPDLSAEDDPYSVSGIVIDERTGERLENVSIYEKTQLVATLTDNHGYFRLNFKGGNNGPLAITVSKLAYQDTTLNFLRPVKVSGKSKNAAYVSYRGRGNKVERTGIARMFISAGQMMQSMNIPDFFASRPFQVSLTPGLSSHGMFSPQVVNNFSLNLAGGYTAGTRGLEFGGLFNINKQDAKYVQIAGIFNLVGGNVTGLQLAGAHNRALDTVKGAQVSLFVNKAGAQVSGVQLSALHNETHRLKGLQLGLVNVADTSDGASIGIVNIIRNGFFKVSYSASDLANTNLSLKTGTHAFYSTLLFSANPSPHNKFYAFGLGIGHDLMLSDKLYISAEADYLFANTGLWDDRWAQAKLLLNVQLAKNISLFAGPSYNTYRYTGSQAGYQTKFALPADRDPRVPAHPVKRWTGWEAGIAFNSVFKPAKRTADDSQSWYINLAATGGVAWDEPYGIVTGGELCVQRDLGEQLTGTLSSGYTHFSVQQKHTAEQAVNGDDIALPVNIVPVKAGIRLKTGRSLFIGGEIGEAFRSEQAYIRNNSSNDHSEEPASKPYHSLMYAVSAGLGFKNGLETGIKFEDYGLQSQYKQFALRLGYRIKISR